MASLNKIMIIGNLGRDPEMRYMPNGTPVTNFSVASGRTYTTREGERREETEWFRVAAWNQLAETANQYLTKGQKVYVEGRLRSSEWQENEGNTRHTNEIVASQIIFLDRPSASESGLGDAAADSGADSMGSPALDDLPF